MLINFLFLLSLITNIAMQIPYEFLVINENNLLYSSGCRELIHRNPNLPWKNGYVFQADKVEIDTAPYIGLCFGERIGYESAQYGFYRSGELIPPNCKVIDSSQNVILTKCHNQ